VFMKSLGVTIGKNGEGLASSAVNYAIQGGPCQSPKC